MKPLRMQSKQQLLFIFVVLQTSSIFCVGGLFDVDIESTLEDLDDDTRELDDDTFSKLLSRFSLEELESFDGFKNIFDKTYPNKYDEEVACINFLNNHRDVKSHNLRYNAGLESYKRQVSEFSDMSNRQFNEKMNGFVRPFEARSAGNVNGGEMKLAKELNWVEKGFVTPVLNQRLCGSCWSFASTGAIEGQIFKTTGRLVPFSPQHLIDCDRDDENGNFGCEGGDFMSAFTYLIGQGGVALASKYPYKANDTFECNYKKSMSGGTISSYKTIAPGNETNLQKMLLTYGPIACATDASHPSFQTYKKGIYYEKKCTTEVNHAMLLVGYGTDVKLKKDYWLIKNSYGVRWGEKGYLRLARNADNHCGITEFVAVPIC